MQINLTTLITILGIAVVTYLTRVGGIWLMSFVHVSEGFKTWVNILPGTILIAIIAPTVFSGSFADAGASLATVLVFVRTRNVLLSMVIGIGAVVGLRMLQAHFF